MLTNSPKKLSQRNDFLMRKERATISRSGKTCPLSRTCLKDQLYVRGTCLRQITSVNPAWVVCPSSPACNLRLKCLEAVSMTSDRKPQILKVSSKRHYSPTVRSVQSARAWAETKAFRPKSSRQHQWVLCQLSLLTEQVSSEKQRKEKSPQNRVLWQ